MPHFTLQNSPQGPLLNAVISVSAARHNALISGGLPVPAPQVIRALVDTGASVTSIDPSVLTALNLTPTGSTLVHTPSTGSQSAKNILPNVKVSNLLIVKELVISHNAGANRRGTSPR